MNVGKGEEVSGVGALENPKHEQFCQEYLLDLNRTQAYIRSGYSPKNAESAAARLYANVKVRARVDELLAARSVRTGVTQDRVVRELARIAFLDPTKLADMGKATVQEDATEDDRAAIAAIKVKSGEDFTEREVKFADKLKALELLGKHLNMFTDTLQLTGEVPRIVDDIGGGPLEVGADG
ncbi:MAG: terminase small subunit [Candidatus Limiplasma sp.]|nr:terminase small subunit [Candidatus Limiplasma sp.]